MWKTFPKICWHKQPLLLKTSSSSVLVWSCQFIVYDYAKTDWYVSIDCTLIFFSRKELIISRMTIATITHDFLKYYEILNFQVAVRNQFETNFFFVLCFGLEVSGPLFWILGLVWAVRRFVSLVQSVLQWCHVPKVQFLQANCHFPKSICPNSF